MFFQPKHYQTLEALREASIYADSTSSNEVLGNVEVFGYVNNSPYEAVLSETHHWIAGEVIL